MRISYVPYRPAPFRTASDMITRTMTSTGSRANGLRRAQLGALGASAPVSGAAKGAATGASIGSAVPLIGTAVGAILGAVGGAIAGVLGKQDQEIGNFTDAVNLWQRNRTAVLNIANKYLALAGLFDLKLNNPHIPIYLQYGRMGEERFTRDLTNLIYQAGQDGRITANDTPLTVKNNIVQPWIDSWGKGPMVDPHGDMIDLLILGMVTDYLAGRQNTWLARGGQWPFANVPKFALRAPAPVPMVPQPQFQPQPLPPVQFFPQPAVPSVTSPPPPMMMQPLPVQVPLATPAAPATGQTPTPQAASTPQFPAGFSAVGTDSNGNPVFSSPQGVLYQWTGAAMVGFNGQLAGNNSVAAQIQAAIQSALAQGQSQAQAAQTAMQAAQAAGVPVTPALQQQVASQAAATAAAPSVQSAGIGRLSGMGSVLAVGAAILALMFATARPAPGGKHG